MPFPKFGRKADAPADSTPPRAEEFVAEEPVAEASVAEALAPELAAPELVAEHLEVAEAPVEAPELVEAAPLPPPVAAVEVPVAPPLKVVEGNKPNRRPLLLGALAVAAGAAAFASFGFGGRAEVPVAKDGQKPKSRRVVAASPAEEREALARLGGHAKPHPAKPHWAKPHTGAKPLAKGAKPLPGTKPLAPVKPFAHAKPLVHVKPAPHGKPLAPVAKTVHGAKPLAAKPKPVLTPAQQKMAIQRKYDDMSRFVMKRDLPHLTLFFKSMTAPEFAYLDKHKAKTTRDQLLGQMAKQMKTVKRFIRSSNKVTAWKATPTMGKATVIADFAMVFPSKDGKGAVLTGQSTTVDTWVKGRTGWKLKSVVTVKESAKLNGKAM